MVKQSQSLKILKFKQNQKLKWIAILYIPVIIQYGEVVD